VRPVSALDRFSHVSALKPVAPATARATELRAPSGEDPLSRLLGAGIAENRYGEHVVLRNWYSTPEFAEPNDFALEVLTRQGRQQLRSASGGAFSNPREWLFLDTETTGLSGGSGTYAFLIGLAWWDAGGLQVEQLIMRDFAEEHSVLHQLAEHIALRPALVTFNGKTFDWPLLETRFRMTRQIKLPQISGHLDLLHPARALWKLRLGSVRLCELERYALDPARLGWSRDDDIRSALIPQYYFDYLRGGPPTPLAGVVRHNAMDLRGLAALFVKMNELLSSKDPGEACDALDLFGLSRFLDRRGESERAHGACAQAVRLGLPSEFRPDAQRDLALHAKRQGDHQAAAALWALLANDPQHGSRACEQLAIHYERREKNFGRAIEFAELALLQLERLNGSKPLCSSEKGHAQAELRLTRRLGRLRRRQQRLSGWSQGSLQGSEAVSA
jgi:uncharacterized protein